jgi:sulfite exporter TauE/SafE
LKWLWPVQLNEDPSQTVRIGRVIHWAAAGAALFLIVITLTVLIESDEDVAITTYISVALIWTGLALLGRGVRYILSKE